MARSLRMQAEADFDRVGGGPLEAEEAGQLAVLVADGEVDVASEVWAQQLREVVRIGRPIVESERLWVVPASDLLRIRLSHRAELERLVAHVSGAALFPESERQLTWPSVRKSAVKPMITLVTISVSFIPTLKASRVERPIPVPLKT